MRKVLRLLCLAFFSSFPLLLYAQVNVTGTIVDSRNSPVNGASIRVRGTNLGTVSDANGKFSLSIPGSSGTLDISFVGYQPQSVQVSSTVNEVTITLLDDVGNLNEVVITG